MLNDFAAYTLPTADDLGVIPGFGAGNPTWQLRNRLRHSAQNGDACQRLFAVDDWSRYEWLGRFSILDTGQFGDGLRWRQIDASALALVTAV